MEGASDGNDPPKPRRGESLLAGWIYARREGSTVWMGRYDQKRLPY